MRCTPPSKLFSFPSSHMKSLLPYLFLSLSLLCAAVSCRNEPAAPAFNFGSERYDSAALHLALVPNRDCLPIYYAERVGIYDSLGLHLQIASYASQMDCDTALMGRFADGGWADLVRRQHYGKRMPSLEVMWTGSLRWALFTCGQLRLNTVKSLSGHTVATARESAEDKYLSQVVKEGKLSADNVYRPLINDLRLRAVMLNGSQVDAALLTWPYTSLALSQGNRLVTEQRFADANECFVMKSKSLSNPVRKRQWQLLEQGRRMALDSIRLKGLKVCAEVLRRDYGLPKQVADTLRY